MREVAGQRADQGVDDVGQGVSAGLRERGVDRGQFGPLVRAWRDAAAGYSDEELRLLLDFQRRFEGIVRDQLARLRGDLDRGARG